MLNEIIGRLNKAIRETYLSISGLQSFRKGKRTTTKFFHQKNINGDYAFHSGGSTETQFNIGMDSVDGKPVVRYGISFSLKKTRTLTNPIGDIGPRVNLYNEYIQQYGTILDSYQWSWNGDNRSSTDDMDTFAPSDIATGKFLFVGRYFHKSFEELSEDDIHTIVEYWNELYPVYLYIEKGMRILKQSGVEHRMSRICWNTNGWRLPSGTVGKSTSKDAHEHTAGFGFEEWLFDLDKLINGYHYGFLQTINKTRSAFENKVMNIKIYTRDNDSKQWYWVGEIKNAEIIDKAEDSRILAEYEKRGWLDEMRTDVIEVGGNPSILDEYKDDSLFNIKFQPHNLVLYDSEPVPFYESEKVPLGRYVLFKDNELPVTKDSDQQPSKPKSDVLKLSGVKKKSEDKICKSSSSKVIEYDNLHNVIQNGLCEYLEKEFPNKKIHTEAGAYGNTKIDVCVEGKDSHFSFYEVKSYSDTKTSIRMAMGQLIEYCYYPLNNRAQKLYIVAHTEINDDVRSYMKHLRESLKLPIYYLQFNATQKKVIDKA